MQDPRLILGDCLDVLPTLEAGSVDCVLTDPPYGLSFMGKDWDHAVPGVRYWREILRVLKPGGYALAFGGTRTFHRQVCAIEDAGFEVRDTLMWVTGQGFPKGKGCLKPAWEPITLARRPGPKVLPLGIGECRVGTSKPGYKLTPGRLANTGLEGFGRREGRKGSSPDDSRCDPDSGRWPPNLLLQHHPECNGSCHPDCVVRALGEQGGERKAAPHGPGVKAKGLFGVEAGHPGYPDSGTAARFYPQFFYCPKASRRDRHSGLDNHETIEIELMSDVNSSQEMISWENAGRRVRLLVDTGPSLPRVIDGFEIRGREAADWSRFLFGSESGGRSLSGCKSTTRMGTSSTTESRTLSWLTRSLTSESIPDASCEMACGSSHAVSAEPSTPSITITFGETAYPPGVASAASGTRLRISGNVEPAGNTHNTVKPAPLMEWLVKLVAREGEVVLDPFMGSGSTGKACMRTGRGFVGIELDPRYFAIAEKRIDAERAKMPLFAGEVT